MVADRGHCTHTPAGSGMFPRILLSQDLWSEMCVGVCGCKECLHTRQWVRMGVWHTIKSRHFATSYQLVCQESLQRITNCTGDRFIQWWRRVSVTFLRFRGLQLLTIYSTWEHSIWERGWVTISQTKNCITTIGLSPRGQSIWAEAWFCKKGTDNDKQHLPAATYLNWPWAAGLKRRRGANAVAIRLEQPAEGQRRRGPHTAIEHEVQVTHHANNNSSNND